VTESFIEQNDRERERMRALVGTLDHDALARPVNPEWTVAGVLAHIAFWDARVEFLVAKRVAGEPFTSDDDEPEDVSWINDATRPLIHAIAPRVAAELALDIAARTDAAVASLPADQMYPADPTSLINPFRSQHRGEHLDEIEASLER
jgi:hypothetical protein